MKERIFGVSDQRDHFIEVIQRDEIPFKNMRSLLRLRQFKLCSADDYLMTMFYKMNNQILQVQRLGSSFYKSDIVDTE